MCSCPPYLITVQMKMDHALHPLLRLSSGVRESRIFSPSAHQPPCVCQHPLMSELLNTATLSLCLHMLSACSLSLPLCIWTFVFLACWHVLSLIHKHTLPLTFFFLLSIRYFKSHLHLWHIRPPTHFPEKYILHDESLMGWKWVVAVSYRKKRDVWWIRMHSGDLRQAEGEDWFST